MRPAARPNMAQSVWGANKAPQLDDWAEEVEAEEQEHGELQVCTNRTLCAVEFGARAPAAASCTLACTQYRVLRATWKVCQAAGVGGGVGASSSSGTASER